MASDDRAHPDSTEGMLAAITLSVAAQLEELPWDSESLMFEVHLGATGDLPAQVRDHLGVVGDAETLTGPAWMLNEPSTLHGHPFDALIGTHASAEAVGVVLAVEGWLTGNVEGFDAQRSPDGRVEVRNVYSVLRDGTTASALSVRGGDTHLIGAVDGKIPAALRRVVGAPSLLPTDTPIEVVLRAWMHYTLLAVDTIVTDAGRDDLAALVEGASVADAAVAAAATSEQVLSTVLPLPYRWLLTCLRAQPETGWDDLYEAMRGADVDLLRWVLLNGSKSEWTPEYCNDEFARRALIWCDPAMFAHLFDVLVPDAAMIESSLGAFGESTGLTVTYDELRGLASTVLQPRDGSPT